MDTTGFTIYNGKFPFTINVSSEKVEDEAGQVFLADLLTYLLGEDVVLGLADYILYKKTSSIILNEIHEAMKDNKPLLVSYRDPSTSICIDMDEELKNSINSSFIQMESEENEGEDLDFEFPMDSSDIINDEEGEEEV